MLSSAVLGVGVFLAAMALSGILVLLPVVLAVMAVAVAAGGWRIKRGRLTTRPLETEASALVDRIVETTGVDPERLFVVTENDADLWRPFSIGAGPLKRIYVPAHLLKGDGDDVFPVLVQLAVPSAFRIYRLVAIGLWVGSALTMRTILARTSDPSVGVQAVSMVVILSPIALVAIGRRLVYRWDDRASELVGRAELAGSIADQADTADLGRFEQLLRTVLMVPPTEKRIERLRR